MAGTRDISFLFSAMLTVKVISLIISVNDKPVLAVAYVSCRPSNKCKPNRCNGSSQTPSSVLSPKSFVGKLT